ncbi:MAG: ribosomal RNA small subunit methyltransferase A [Clostridia bacterium]|nr:ribosomal RNA small subunit methyltransferase A [Clostridia bacterium]
MDILQTTKFLMKKYNITASKALGQNFLINEEVIDKAIKASSISKSELVIEIGPGLGTLTEKLAENVGKVICIELDKKMIGILKDRFLLYNNVELINGDILELDLNEIIEKSGYSSAKIVANLPYYITTPIIMKVLEGKAKLDSITVMVQKEVADRLCAKTGARDAGAITYAVEYYSNAKKIVNVPKESFVPIPNVESEVIMLEVVKNKFENVKDEKKLFEIIKYAFMQRRKTLTNALENAGLEKERIKKILRRIKYK